MTGHSPGRAGRAAANSSDGKARMAAVSALLGFTRILSGPPPQGCGPAVNPIVTARGQAVQWCGRGLCLAVAAGALDLALGAGPS